MTIRTIRFALLVCLSLCWVLPPAPASGREIGGYGYLVQNAPPCAVWWAEGAYKVMKDDPVPSAASASVRIAAARNEFEPFLLVLRPEKTLETSASRRDRLSTSKGGTIGAAEHHRLSCRICEGDDADGRPRQGRAGGPILCRPMTGRSRRAAGENHPLWITVRVPKDAAPGLYKGGVELRAEGWSCVVPVELRVWDFTLPDTSSVRSSFGLPTGDIKAYHNLETREELEKVVDLYYQNMRDHRVAPTSPFELYPMKVATSRRLLEGRRVRHRKASTAAAGRSRSTTMIRSNGMSPPSTTAPSLSSDRTPLRADASGPGRRTTDKTTRSSASSSLAENAWIAGANLLKVFKGRTDWKQETIEFPRLRRSAAASGCSLFPAFRDNDGTTTRDRLVRRHRPRGRAEGPEGAIANLLAGRRLRDASRGDEGRRRFHGVRPGRPPLSRRVRLQRLRPPSRGPRARDRSTAGRQGSFAGFRQGTPEYDRLLSQYLRQVEDHLAANGWLGREYIYWFDEPDPKDYPFVREGCSTSARTRRG